MKESVAYARAYWASIKFHAEQHWQPFVAAAVILFGIYTLSLLVEPGVVTYLLAIPPAIVILVTALARLNDMGLDKRALHWHVRRVGFVMAGAAAGMTLASPLADDPFVPWRGVILLWGLALAWLTTPDQEPWWRYITGTYRVVPRPYPRSPLARLFDHFTRR